MGVAPDPAGSSGTIKVDVRGLRGTAQAIGGIQRGVAGQPPLVDGEHGAAATSLLAVLRHWSRARRNPPAAHAAPRRQPVGGVTFGGGKKVHMRPPHDR